MKGNRIYRKLYVASVLRIFFLYFAVISFLGGIHQIIERDMYQYFWTLVITFACLAVSCTADIKRSRIAWGYCDFEAHREQYRRLLAKKKYRRYARFHLELLFTCLILGRYEECLHEIEELHLLERRVGGLSGKHKLQLHLWSIDYMLSVNETEYLGRELEEAREALERLGGIRDKRRWRIGERIRLRQYLAEERWEDILELLKDFPWGQRNVPVYTQVFTAYIRGKCYYQLGRYREALRELRFTARWGGGTKYVSLANELIEKIPERYLHEDGDIGEISILKYKTGIKGIFLAASCFLAILSAASVYYHSCGSSVEEAFGRRYLFDADEFSVVYSENIGEYELAVLNGKGRAGYCLFRKTSGSGCRIVESFRTDKSTENEALKEWEIVVAQLPEDERKIFQSSEAKWDVQKVMTGFYQRNDIFSRQDMKYVGITCFPEVENVTINGKPIYVERIDNADGETIYLWSVEGIDLKENIGGVLVEESLP